MLIGVKPLEYLVIKFNSKLKKTSVNKFKVIINIKYTKRSVFVKHSFITDLSINDCESKLKESIIEERKTGIYGKISNYQHTFWIVQKPLNYVNNFQKIFYGEFIKYEEKTLIRGSFSVRKFLKIFTVIMYLFLTLCLGGTIYVLISDIIIGKSDDLGQLIRGIFFILLFAIVVYVMVTRLSKKNTSQEQYVIRFLSNKLNAKEFKENI